MAQAQEWVFYHALYHLVAYWAAFMVALGLLINIGVAVSTTGTHLDGIRRNFCLVAVCTTLLGSWFLLWRVYTFSVLIMAMLPSDYTEKLAPFRPSPFFHGVAFVGTCLLGGFTLAVLFWPNRQKRKPSEN